jgi:hypothetical protein
VNRRRIDAFLAILARELDLPAKAYLTGAAAGALLGRVRPSVDIDLGLTLRKTSSAGWRSVEEAIERTRRLTGIPASVAEDIDRWGMITLLDYKRSSRPYRRFGKLEVRILAPANWAIGKLTRFLDPDIRDVVEVLRHQRASWKSCVRLWGRALRASPASTAQFQFRRHVEHLIARHGERIWGRPFDPQSAVAAFEKAARVSPRAL